MMYDANDGYVGTAPVGSFPSGASRWGLQDIVGNVWEWTADLYAPYPTDAATLTDPVGTVGSERVLRGGGWNAVRPEWARPTLRFHKPPSDQNYAYGFRCVYSPR